MTDTMIFGDDYLYHRMTLSYAVEHDYVPAEAADTCPCDPVLWPVWLGDGWGLAFADGTHVTSCDEETEERMSAGRHAR